MKNYMNIKNNLRLLHAVSLMEYYVEFVPSAFLGTLPKDCEIDKVEMYSLKELACDAVDRALKLSVTPNKIGDIRPSVEHGRNHLSFTIGNNGYELVISETEIELFLVAPEYYDDETALPSNCCSWLLAEYPEYDDNFDYSENKPR